jgi:hypothetical protein
MRLYNISGAYTSNMTMFPDGKGSVTQTVDNGVDTTYALGVSSAGLGIAAALAGPISGAWSCAFWVGCEACSFAQNVSSAQSDGAAEAALQSYIIQITDDQIFIPNAQRTDANIPVNTIPNCCTKQNTTSIGPIGTGQQGIAVGFVYEIHLQSSAAISACMNAISSRDAEAEAQYSWSVGKDTFSIVSSSN